jgi:hypothetical protein
VCTASWVLLAASVSAGSGNGNGNSEDLNWKVRYVSVERGASAFASASTAYDRSGHPVVMRDVTMREPRKVYRSPGYGVSSQCGSGVRLVTAVMLTLGWNGSWRDKICGVNRSEYVGGRGYSSLRLVLLSVECERYRQARMTRRV